MERKQDSNQSETFPTHFCFSNEDRKPLPFYELFSKSNYGLALNGLSIGDWSTIYYYDPNYGMRTNSGVPSAERPMYTRVTIEQLTKYLTNKQEPMNKSTKLRKVSVFGGEELRVFMLAHYPHSMYGGTSQTWYNYNPRRTNTHLFESYEHKDYEEVSVSEFEKMLELKQTSTTKTIKPMKKATEKVIIPAQMLRDGLMAMSSDQKAMFSPKVDLITGECSVGDLRKCYDVVCSEWKGKLSAEFPWLNDPMPLDLTQMMRDGKVFAPSSDMTKSSVMIAIRGCGNYEYKGFFLNDDYSWRFVVDSFGRQVLVAEPK